MHRRYIVETRQWEDLELPEAQSNNNRSASTLLVAGMGAAYTGNLEKVAEAAARLETIRKKQEADDKAYEAQNIAIMQKEVAALIQLKKGKTGEALKLMAEATAIEDGATLGSSLSHETLSRALRRDSAGGGQVR